MKYLITRKEIEEYYNSNDNQIQSYFLTIDDYIDNLIEFENYQII